MRTINKKMVYSIVLYMISIIILLLFASYALNLPATQTYENYETNYFSAFESRMANAENGVRGLTATTNNLRNDVANTNQSLQVMDASLSMMSTQITDAKTTANAALDKVDKLIKSMAGTK